MYNTLCLSSIRIKLVIYCIWLVSFHHFAHFLYQILIFFYFSFFYSKFCSKMYLIVVQCCPLPKTTMSGALAYQLNYVKSNGVGEHLTAILLSFSLPQCEPVVFSICAYCKPSIARHLCLLLYHFASKSFNPVGVFCNRIDSNIDHNWFLRHLPFHHSTANRSQFITPATTTSVVSGGGKRPVLSLIRTR